MRPMFLSLLLAFTGLTAAAQDVIISPQIIETNTFTATDGTVYTNYTYYHLIIGEQFVLNECQLQESAVSDFSSLYTSAWYGCNFNSDQYVVGAFPSWLPHAFFRSLNTPCGQGIVAAAGVWAEDEMSDFWHSLRFKVAKVDGKLTVKIDPTGTWCLTGAPPSLIPNFNGTKRFYLVPFAPIAN